MEAAEGDESDPNKKRKNDRLSDKEWSFRLRWRQAIQRGPFLKRLYYTDEDI
jgi:hypothetical protein